jgi:hypothetical protein
VKDERVIGWTASLAGAFIVSVLAALAAHGEAADGIRDWIHIGDSCSIDLPVDSLSTISLCWSPQVSERSSTSMPSVTCEDVRFKNDPLLPALFVSSIYLSSP